MAVIFSYPPIQSTDVTASDRLILSQMNSDGNPTRSITVGELSKAIKSGSATGGPYLPLTAGPTVPLTGDLYMAPTGAGPSVGSNAIVFKGVDDTGAELTSAEIFTLDSAINPSGQDLYFNNADDAGVLQTGLYIDAFQQVAIAKSPATAQLDVGGSFNADGNVTFSGYGSGTKTGVAAYSLAVTAAGLVIEEPTSSGIPWPYQFNGPSRILIQGVNPGTTGSDNTAYGSFAGSSLTSGFENTFIGSRAGTFNSTGDYNVAVGFDALQLMSAISDGNTAIGTEALKNFNGPQFARNTAVGYKAGELGTDTFSSVFVGYQAGQGFTTQGNNTAIGYAALRSGGGGQNTGVGRLAMTVGAGDDNTAIGDNAAANLTTGNENLVLGSAAGTTLTTGSNNIIIGYDAEPSAAGVDNEITIGSINHDTLKMPGLSTGATDGQVMTYESATDQIRLKDASTGAGSTIDYTTTNGYRIRIYLENITPGSPDFGQAFPAMQQIIFKRQNAAAGTQGGLPFNVFYNQYTPALDPGYDAGFGCGTSNMCMLPMMEESTADVNTLNSGGSVLGSAFTIFTTDVAALNSYRLPLRMRVDNGGASPGNGTLRMTLIDGSQSAPSAADATALPSTVSVYFRDTTLTSSTVARPPFNLLWAGKDTQFAIQQNGGAAYTNSLDYVFTGNGAGDIPRKYELFFQDEYNAYNRCSYLKVTDGRVVFEDLPTADPVSKGVLWNDAGTLKISLG